MDRVALANELASSEMGISFALFHQANKLATYSSIVIKDAEKT